MDYSQNWESLYQVSVIRETSTDCPLAPSFPILIFSPSHALSSWSCAFVPRGWGVGIKGSQSICRSHAHTGIVSNDVNSDTKVTSSPMITFQLKLNVSTNQLPIGSVVLSGWRFNFSSPGDFVRTAGVGGRGFQSCYWHLVCKGRGYCKHSSRYRTAPTVKNYPAQNVKSAKTGKPCWLDPDSWVSKIRLQSL